jgi:hypothetical protein
MSLTWSHWKKLIDGFFLSLTTNTLVIIVLWNWIDQTFCVYFHCNIQSIKQISIPSWLLWFYININYLALMN